MLYKNIFLKDDVSLIEKNLSNKTKVKNILDSIHPTYYETIFAHLKQHQPVERLLQVTPFRLNDKLYSQYFFHYDVELIVNNIEDKDVLKEILPMINEGYIESIYAEVMEQLPIELAKKYAGYGQYVEKKNDLSFLLEQEEDTTNLQEQIEALKKEIEWLKQEKQPVSETDTDTPPAQQPPTLTLVKKEEEDKVDEAADEVTDEEDDTEELGKEIFKV